MQHEMTDPCVSTRCPPPAPDGDGPPPAGEAAIQELALLAKAIAHPARVQILRILAEREACVCGELVDEFILAQSTVSEHLRILKDAGLIRGDIRSPHVCYCLEPARVRRLKTLVASL